MKTINEIYRPNEKIQPESAKKSRQLSTKSIKFRSNSHHNLPTTKTLPKDDPLKETKNQPLKTNRSLSKRQIPRSVARGSAIDLNAIQVNKAEMKRQNSHKILRSSSANKLSTHASVQRERNPTSGKGNEANFTKKKNTVIENMLEKKLAVFKRKQAVY